MSATEQNDDQQQPAIEGPGKQLRDIRIAKELEIVRVASLLHLDVDLLESLEADDYSNMPGTVFVQGYLRNYARLLDTPSEPILDAFRSHRPVGTAESDLSMRHLKPEVRSSHTVVRLITWLIVIGIVALVFTWWRGYLQWPLDLGFSPTDPVTGQQSESGQDRLPAGATLLPEQQSAGPEIAPPSLLPESAIRRSGPESEVSTAEVPEADNMPQSSLPGDDPVQPQSLPATGDAGPGLPVTGPLISSGLPVQSPVDGDAPDLRPVLPAIIETGDGSVQQPAAGVDGRVVKVTFSDNCWTDIRDSSGEFRLIGNKQAGEQVELGGEPPYSMVFGNASAVDITVGGEHYDLAPHIRGNVARFSLNPDA